MNLAKDLSLRQKAERLLKDKRALQTTDFSEADNIKILYELEVHQIELELQNEELQLAKERADANSEKHTHLYDFSPSGYFTLDANSNICELNINGAKMLAKERLELINTPFNLFITPNERDVFMRFLAKVVETKTKQSCELELMVKGNASIYTHIEAAFSEREQRCLLSLVDITERKQTEQSLRESEEKLSSYIDNAPDGVFVVDENGRYLEVNRASEKVTGYSRAELLTMSVPQITPPEEGKYAEISFAEVKETGSSKTEGMFLHKSGQKRWWSVDSVKLSETRYLGFTKDITDSKQAEKNLKESNERFNLAMEVTTDGLWDWDLMTNEIYYSPRWKSILGYAEHELPNDFSVWERLTTEEDVKKSWDMLNKHIAGDLDKFEMESKMRHKDGHWVDIFSRATAYRNEQGKAYRVVGTHTDITERKKAESQIKKSEELFRKMMYNMPSGVAIYKAVNNANDFEFIELNKKAEEITKGAKHEIIGHTLLEKFPDMKDGPFIKSLQKISKDGININLPPFFYQDKERQGWRENIIYKLESGEIVAIFIDVTDIKETEEKVKKQNIELLRAKEEAEASEVKFRKLSNLTFEGILLHKDGIATDINLSFSQIFGYTREEIIGENVINLIAKKEFHNLIFKNIRESYAFPYEVIGLRKDGTEIPIELEARDLDSDNKTTRVSAIRVVSERKKFQEELQQQNIELIVAKNNAEESDRLKSAFLANMSHEIRTPMNGILGFADLLKTPNLSGDEQQRYIGIIEKSGIRMLNIINDIISISKIEAGLTEVNISNSNINDQIEYIYTFFKPEIEGKGMLFLLKNYLPFSANFIETDKEKLFAILTNLVKNAIKYSEKGSIELGCTKKGDELEFYVKDTGIGIDHDRQEAIFERFIQADISDARASQGAGLGLSISKAYVEMLGGALWVVSESGEGSTFYFTIPYVTEQQKIVNVKDETTNDRCEVQVENLKILIVEDDETSDLLLSMMLEGVSREILHARNGLEAIEQCRNHPNLDLIMMDIKMPGISGYEATREIRQFNKHVPIIAQTAFGLSGDREKSIEAGCNEYITKPILIEKLMSLVHSLLSDEESSN